MYIYSTIYLCIYACAYTSLKINHAWTIHIRNMNPTSNAHAGLNKKTFMHACVKIYIDTYIRLCVHAQYALRRRYVTMCIIVYNIYAQKDTNTCTIKLYADAHASFTRAWSNACSNSSLHIYVLQSCHTNWFTNSCISVYANISSRAEHAQWFTIAEVRLQPTSHFEKPICKNVPKIGNKFGNYLE